MRILLVDEVAARADLVEELLLAEIPGTEVFRFHQTIGLVEHVAEVKPDVILMEMDSPRRDCLEQLATLRDCNPTPVVMFTQDPQAQSIQAAVKSGVCAYMTQQINPDTVKPAIELAMATFNTYADLRGQVAKARSELHKHKKVTRAKAIIMNSRGVSEDEAHQLLRKMSMDRKRKLEDIADDIISAAEILRG